MRVRYYRDAAKMKKWARKQALENEHVTLEGESFPGSVAPIEIETEGGFGLVMAAWGMLPTWTDDPKYGKKMAYNARSETVAERPTFRAAFAARRCIIPATSFFERANGRWISFNASSSEVFPIAGIWEPANRLTSIPTFTMITTEPNDVVADIHDRMPVVLSESDVEEWMSGSTSIRQLKRMLTPCPGEWLTWEDGGPIGKPAAVVQERLF